MATVEDVLWASFYAELHILAVELRKMMNEPETWWFPEFEYVESVQIILF